MQVRLFANRRLLFPRVFVRPSVFSLFRLPGPKRAREQGPAVFHEPLLAGHRSINHLIVETAEPWLTSERTYHGFEPSIGELKASSQLSSLGSREKNFAPGDPVFSATSVVGSHPDCDMPKNN